MTFEEVIVLSQVIVALVAVLGLVISLISIKKRKPKIYSRKYSAGFKKDDKRIIEFYFYLGNLGEVPASIEDIEFYTKGKHMPKRKFIKVVEEFIPAGKILTKFGVEPISLPFVLGQNTSIKLKAELEFPDEEEAKKSLNKKGRFELYARIIFNGKVLHKKI